MSSAKSADFTHAVISLNSDIKVIKLTQLSLEICTQRNHSVLTTIN